MQSRLSEKKWTWLGLLALLLSLVVLFSSLGSMALTDRDEGEYAASVSAMFRSGDFVVPTLNGRLYLEKPILVFWAMAATRTVMGNSEAAARLPSALSAFLVLLLAAYLVRHTQKDPAWTALTCVATVFTPLFLLVGRACLTDMLLTLFTTASLASFYLAVENSAEIKRARVFYMLGWAALGFGFLTKGPVAPAVVLPVCFLYALWQRRLWEIIKSSRIHWGIVIFAAINLPWYGLVFWKLGEVFWRSFFVAQNINRFTEVLLGHGGGFLYYLPVLLVGLFPFSPVVLADLGGGFVKHLKVGKKADRAERLRFFAGLSLVWVFIVFSLAATKQINYILPGFPFAGVLAGHFLAKRVFTGEMSKATSRIYNWGLILVGAIWLVVMLALAFGLPLFWDQILGSIRPDSSEYALPQTAPLLLLWPLAGIVGVLACLSGWYFFKKGKRALSVGGVVLGSILFSSVLILGILPQAAGVMQEPSRQLAREAYERIPEKARVVTYGLWKPSLFYYLDRDLKRYRVEDLEKLAKEAQTSEPLFAFTRLTLKDRLENQARLRSLAVQGGYMLVGNESASQAWQTKADQDQVEPGSQG